MLIGKRVGERYEIRSHLGGGGMSHVYLAHDIILGRDVAMKILRYDFTNEEEWHHRFQREALSATSLTHPNIVSVYDVGEDGDMHYIVMEYVKGKTLKQYIQEFSPVSPAKSVQIMKQLTSAMANAHEMGIIHRDIKPQNILMNEEGIVKVTDFGIATTLNATSYTQTNSVMGTVHYLSPEQARGGIATKKSDIYALGIVLYELLTGELPFSGESAVSIALKHLQSETPSVRKFDASIPQALENVVLKATAKDADHRYATVEEMEQDLQTSLTASRMDEPKFLPPIDDDATKAIPIIRERMLSSNELNMTKKFDATAATQATLPVSPPVEEKPKKKRRWPLFLAAIFTLAVLGFVALIIFTPSKVEIPDVSNLSIEEATEKLESAGFVVGEQTKRYDADVEENIVIETKPKAGLTRVEKSKIDLIVSLGVKTNTVADYTGSSIAQVESLVEQLGYKEIVIEYQYTDNPENQVIAQQPEPNSEVVLADTVLKLTVSKGIEQVILSNLLGYTEAAAVEYARTAGLQLVKGEAIHSETVPAGNVVSQQPAGNVAVPSGSKVTIILSKGPAEKPVRSFFRKVDVPYTGELDEEGNPIPQIVHIYLQDKTNTMADLYEEIVITENISYDIQLEIVEDEKASYQILVDDKVIAKETISYE